MPHLGRDQRYRRNLIGRQKTNSQILTYQIGVPFHQGRDECRIEQSDIKRACINADLLAVVAGSPKAASAGDGARDTVMAA